MTDEPVEPDSSAPVVPPLLSARTTRRSTPKGAWPSRRRCVRSSVRAWSWRAGRNAAYILLPQSEFRRIAAQIQRVSVGNKAARQYLRVFLSGAVDQDTDKQGRVVVPQMLREYADLGDDIVVIGVGTRAEIWNRKAWEQYLSDNEPEYSDIADDVLPDLEF